MMLVLVYALLANRGLTASGPADPIQDVGGVKFSVHEALMGAIMSIIFVLCAVSYGRFIQEANQMRSAEIMGAWHFGYVPDAANNNDKIVAWLMSSVQNSSDAAPDYQIELAVSLADRHVITSSAFLAIDPILRYGIWSVAVVAIAQSLLNSRQLHGLRILMPAMIITLIVFLLLFLPEASDLAKLLGRQGSAVPSLGSSS